MPAKLNQIIAIEKGIKARTYGAVTDLHKAVQKPELFNGFSKDYQAKDDSDEKLPSERKRVQFTAPDVLRAVERATTELMDVTARKDWTNCVANGDVVVAKLNDKNGQSNQAAYYVHRMGKMEKRNGRSD